MAGLDGDTLRKVMDLMDFGTREVARLLERPQRTIQCWLAADGPGKRNLHPGEVERLCMMIDPAGERPDVIGWIVLAARARYENSEAL